MASILSAGTSSGTALNLTGDTSGILQLASNNGTVGLTMDTSQNIGIGTTSPGAKLDVAGSVQLSSAGTARSKWFSDGTLVYLTGESTIPFTIWTNGSERMRIDASGNVGIGTTSPQAPLQVSGSISSAPSGTGVFMGVDSASYGVIQLNSPNSTTGGSYIDFSYSGADRLGRIYYDTPTNYMMFQTNALERMRIDSSGNVGIGTTSPGTYGKLAVNGVIDAKAFSGNQNPYSVTTGGSAYNTGNTGLFLFYAQNSGYSIFWYDLVQSSFYGSTTVISSTSYSGGGTPPSRTYSNSGGTLQVAISGGTSGTYTGHYTIIQ